MTAKLTASADGSKVLIGNAAEDALEIDATAKTIKALSPYSITPMASGPLASAYKASQAFSGVATNAQFTALTEVYDTNNALDPTTGIFNPKAAGYYQVTVNTKCSAASNLVNYSSAEVLKNGVLVIEGSGDFRTGSPSTVVQSVLSSLIVMNGTTDTLVAAHSTDAGAGSVLELVEFSVSFVRGL